MSETEKTEIELWYSDLIKMFEYSDVEPTSELRRIPNYSEKILSAIQKFIRVEKILEKSEAVEENFKLNAVNLGIENLFDEIISKICNEGCIGATNTSKDQEEVPAASSKNCYWTGLRSLLRVPHDDEKIATKCPIRKYSAFDVIDRDCYSVWEHRAADKLTFDKGIRKDLFCGRNLNTVVTVGNVKFHCHSFILQSSEYFRRCGRKSYKFMGGEKPLEAVAFSKFYNFAMGERPKIAPKHLLGIVNAAEILEASELGTYCMKLIDSDVYQEKEAFEVLKTVKKYDSPTVGSLMRQRIFKYFLPLVASKDFLEMNVGELCELLECDTIGVNSEIEVFFAAIYWLNFKWQDRSEVTLIRVMSCIRYAFLPSWFIHDLQHGTGTLEVDRVVQDQLVTKMIRNGLRLAATISVCLKDKFTFPDIAQRYGQLMPSQRRWLYDTNCAYHYGAHETVTEAVDYKIFKNYLTKIQKGGEEYWRNFHEGAPNHVEHLFFQPFVITV